MLVLLLCPKGPVLSAGTGSFLSTGRTATFQAQQPETVGSFLETGVAVTLQDGRPAAPGSFSLTGIIAAFELDLLASVRGYALAGGDATLQDGRSVSVGTFAETGIAATFQARLAAAAATYIVTGVPIAEEILLIETSVGGFALSGVSVAFDLEPPAPGQFHLTGTVAYLSYDLLGGGSVISGGTFSRQRWRDMLDEIEREREAECRRVEDEKRRRRAEKERRRRVAVEARKAAREAAKAEGEAIADALARTNAERAAAGIFDLAAALRDSARLVASARGARAHELAAAQDEEEALMLLLAA